MRHDMTIRSVPIASPEVLTGASKIAAFLGVTPRQVYHWCEQDVLPHFRIGRTVCARAWELREWLDGQRK